VKSLHYEINFTGPRRKIAPLKCSTIFKWCIVPIGIIYFGEGATDFVLFVNDE